VGVTTFLWMFVVLKIPIAALLWLVWWAIKEPEPVVDDDQEGGGSDRHHHRRPRHPRPPRRGGPHGLPTPTPPARVRTHARGRRLTRP
jgi:hypothetical protein